MQKKITSLIILSLVTSFLCFAALPQDVQASTTEFKAGFFTLGDIVVFSYQDGLTVSIYDAAGTLLTTQSLNKGEHYFYNPGSGVYYAIGNQPFSLLMGDPVTNSVMGYFAANDSFCGVAKEFYTYASSDQDVIVFAYSSGTTDVNVEQWNGVAWEALSSFSLTGPGDHYYAQAYSWSSKWLHFTSNQPISVECYSDRCFFVPSETGLWSGTHFYLFAGWYGGGDNIHVHSYKNGNAVIVKYIGGSTIWNGTLNDGEWVNLDYNVVGSSKYVEVISTDTVTVSDEPYFTSDYYGLLTVSDQSGTGVGTKLYTYARDSPPNDLGGIWVFAYMDSTTVEIRDMTAGGTVAWSGTLNKNQYYQFIPAMGTGGHLFGIFSGNVVSAVEGSGGWGAAFVPLYSAAQIILPKAIIDSPLDGAVVPVRDVTMIYHSPDTNIAYFEVRVDGGSWINNGLLTSHTFFGLADGQHTLEVRAINTDQIVGIPVSVTISIRPEHEWTYIFEDSFGRGTILKINTAEKVFQFITPNKDYGIRTAINMRASSRTVVINYRDNELRLVTLGIDTQLDFCMALASDVQTQQQYILFDKPGPS